MTVDLEASSDDSFSSRADNKYNRGATDFLALIEEHYKRNNEAMSRSEHFASLAIQMMDLSIDKIPEVMNQMGWNAKQVSQVWSGSIALVKVKLKRWILSNVPMD